VGNYSEMPPINEAAHLLALMWPHQQFSGIPYILIISCTWHDVPDKYGIKLTENRYNPELCEKGVCQAIFLDLLRSRCKIQKIDLFHCATNTKDIPANKGISRL